MLSKTSWEWFGVALVLPAALTLGIGLRLAAPVGPMFQRVALLLDPVRAADKWLVLGLTGLSLIALAVFLERKREQVLVLSRHWLTRVGQWE